MLVCILLDKMHVVLGTSTLLPESAQEGTLFAGDRVRLSNCWVMENLKLGMESNWEGVGCRSGSKMVASFARDRNFGAPT